MVATHPRQPLPQPVSSLPVALPVTQPARPAAAQRVQLPHRVTLVRVVTGSTGSCLAALLLLLLLGQACRLSHVGWQLLQLKAQHAAPDLKRVQQGEGMQM